MLGIGGGGYTLKNCNADLCPKGCPWVTPGQKTEDLKKNSLSATEVCITTEKLCFRFRKAVELYFQGAKVFQVEAVDGDAGVSTPNPIFYRMLVASPFFGIEESSGWVTVARSLDRESSSILNNHGAITLSIQVQKSAGKNEKHRLFLCGTIFLFVSVRRPRSLYGLGGISVWRNLLICLRGRSLYCLGGISVWHSSLFLFLSRRSLYCVGGISVWHNLLISLSRGLCTV